MNVCGIFRTARHLLLLGTYKNKEKNIDCAYSDTRISWRWRRYELTLYLHRYFNVATTPTSVM